MTLKDVAQTIDIIQTGGRETAKPKLKIRGIKFVIHRNKAEYLYHRLRIENEKPEMVYILWDAIDPNRTKPFEGWYEEYLDVLTNNIWEKLKEGVREDFRVKHPIEYQPLTIDVRVVRELIPKLKDKCLCKKDLDEIRYNIDVYMAISGGQEADPTW